MTEDVRFNLSNYSSRDNRNMGRYARQTLKAEESGEYDLADELNEKFWGIIGKVLEYVPQSYLVDGAPDTTTIDWTNIESQQWLRADYEFSIMNQLKEVFENRGNLTTSS